MGLLFSKVAKAALSDCFPTTTTDTTRSTVSAPATADASVPPIPNWVERHSPAEAAHEMQDTPLHKLPDELLLHIIKLLKNADELQSTASSTQTDNEAGPSDRSSNQAPAAQIAPVNPLQALLATCSKTRRVAQDWTLYKAETAQLLKHVVAGRQHQASLLLEQYPMLVNNQFKGTVTDFSGRTFKNITAFQYAVWARDIYMMYMLLGYKYEFNADNGTCKLVMPLQRTERGLTDEQALTQINEWNAHMSNRAEGPVAEGECSELIRVPKNKDELTPCDKALVFDVDAFIDSLLGNGSDDTPNKIPNLARATLEDGTPLLDDIKQALKGYPDIEGGVEGYTRVSNSAVHHDLQVLVNAYRYYIDNSDAVQASDNNNYIVKSIEFWEKVICGLQRRLPRHVLQEYCHPEKTFSPDGIDNRFDIADVPRSVTAEYYHIHGAEYRGLYDDAGGVGRFGDDFGICRGVWGMRALRGGGGGVSSLSRRTPQRLRN